MKFNGCYFLERQAQYDSDTFELAQQRREDAALVTSLQPWLELEVYVKLLIFYYNTLMVLMVFFLGTVHL